jgi:hypothetical protein
MDTKNIIFVPTIQHTGTWFVLKYLKQFVPICKEAAEILKDKKIINQQMIIHAHLPIPDSIEGEKSLSFNAIEIMSNIFKTVIPIRDPFAAILTREARHPELRHFYIVDGFKYLSASMQDNPNIKFFPVDLPMRSLLIDTMVHCGIDPHPHHDIICQTAKSWKPENPTPNNRFKRLYKRKNIKQIRFLLGPKWSEIEYLKIHASVILPFLASIGYAKEDLNLW